MKNYADSVRKRYQITQGNQLQDYALPGREASFLSQSEAKLVDDEATRVRILAENRFPGLPEEERLNRYRMMPSKDIAFSEGNNWYRSMSDGPKGLLTDMAGHFPTIIGGIAGATRGPIAGVVGTMAGETVRQSIGPGLYDQPIDPQGSLLNIGLEGGLTGLGVAAERFLGGSARTVANRYMNPSRALGYDPVRTAKNYAEAARKRVKITPAEASNSRSLKNQQSFVAEQPHTADDFGDFYDGRSGEVDTAIRSELDSISPVPSSYQGYRKGADALAEELSKRKAYRASQAEPHYEAAKNDSADISDYVDNLKDIANESSGTPFGLEYRRMYNALTTKNKEGERVAKSSVGEIHRAKIMLDDIITRVHTKGGGKGLERELVKKRNELTDLLVDQSDDYSKGMAAYKRTSPPVNEVESMAASDVLPKKAFADPKYSEFGNKVFGPKSSPQDILASRKVLKRQNPEAWDATVKGFLLDRLEGIKESAVGGENSNLGGRFRKIVFGSPNDKRKLRAALTPAQFKAIDNFAELLNATSRVTKGQSATQPRQEMAKSVRAGAKDVRSVLMSPRTATMEFLDERAMEKNLEKLAQIMTNTRSMRDFNEAVLTLRRYAPGRKRYSASVYENVVTNALSTFAAIQAKETNQ